MDMKAFLNISSRATLKNTLTAKETLSETKVRDFYTGHTTDIPVLYTTESFPPLGKHYPSNNWLQSIVSTFSYNIIETFVRKRNETTKQAKNFKTLSHT